MAPTSDTRKLPAIDTAPQGDQDLVLTVEVTENMIAKGHPANCHDCPIALAIVAALTRIGCVEQACAPVTVYGDRADIWLRDGSAYSGHLPHTARHFIAHFDHVPGPSPSPFTFQVAFVRLGHMGSY